MGLARFALGCACVVACGRAYDAYDPAAENDGGSPIDRPDASEPSLDASSDGTASTDASDAATDADGGSFDGSCPSTATLDPLRKQTNLVLSQGNLLVTDPTNSANDNVFATGSAKTGKWYFEVKWQAFAGTFYGVGIASVGALQTESGLGLTGCSFGSGGVACSNGSAIPTSKAYKAADVVGVAFDLGVRRVWFSVNGAWVSGNPNAGTGGYSYSDPDAGGAGGYVPAINLSHGDEVRASFGPFAYPPPVAFSAWGCP